MKEQFYKLPLSFGSFFNGQGGTLEKCSELESIDQSLGLLLTTYPGEHTFDPEFGTRIWDLDFERMVTQAHWESQFEQYVRQAVEQFEHRITDVKVEIDVKEVVHEEGMMDTTAIRRRVDITILGKLVSTGQKCGFRHSLYLGPLSNL